MSTTWPFILVVSALYAVVAIMGACWIAGETTCWQIGCSAIVTLAFTLAVVPLEFRLPCCLAIQLGVAIGIDNNKVAISVLIAVLVREVIWQEARNWLSGAY